MSIDSSLRLLDYLNKVAKEPIILNGKEYGTPFPHSVRLSDSFFMKDSCIMCGRCCMRETNAWTEEGMKRIKSSVEEDFTKWDLDYGVLPSLLESIEERVYNINGKEVTFYSCPKLPEKECPVVSWDDKPARYRCRWMIEKEGTYRCSIHPVRSITCALPHCRFYFSRSTRATSITLSQYGRNWALKCPIKFEPVLDEEGVQNRMLWLGRLNDAAKDCGIDTWLPEILYYLNEGYRKPCTFSGHGLFRMENFKVEVK